MVTGNITYTNSYIGATLGELHLGRVLGGGISTLPLAELKPIPKCLRRPKLEAFNPNNTARELVIAKSNN